MNKNILVAVLAVLAVTLVAVTVVYAAYPGGIMSPQRSGYNNANHEMTEEQCRTQMQGMHNSDFNGSMMGNYDHDAMHNGMMNFNSTASAPSGMMGRGGCH